MKKGFMFGLATLMFVITAITADVLAFMDIIPSTSEIRFAVGLMNFLAIFFAWVWFWHRVDRVRDNWRNNVPMILLLLLLVSSCQPKSAQAIENQIKERCVVIDSYFTENPEKDKAICYIKVLRLSDKTIHGKPIYPTQGKLYEQGDTIIVTFDRYREYATIK